MTTIYYFLKVPKDIDDMCKDYYYCVEQFPHGMFWHHRKKDYIFINLKAFKSQKISEIIKCINHEELHKAIHAAIYDVEDPEWPMEKLGLT